MELHNDEDQQTLICDDDELDIIKESLDSLHENLMRVTNKPHQDHLLGKLLDVKIMCQKLKTPGYESSHG
jgi:hypothetical protein